MKTLDPHWLRVRDLFSHAADLPLDQRAAYLDEHCADDAALRKELEELLASDAGPPVAPKDGLNGGPNSGLRASLITHAISATLDSQQQDRREERVGSVIGQYRLISVLGYGGAGTVYLGERADRQYSARVALKVVDSTLTNADVTRRFLAERQILANLNHPGIAKLFDAGETSEGQPWLVMEYVHGIPIDQYADKHQLTLRQRLHLFIKVCEAVLYAHQNLTVHRDLKPGNILVTPDGVPKLLDFGIAKLLDDNLKAAAEAALTRLHDRVLTPEYASPEQMTGQRVTTASDVYSLGVVLYELLAGIRPYQLNYGNQLEMEHYVCIVDPPRPSEKLQEIKAGHHPKHNLAALAEARSTTPRRWEQELKGDLDAIVRRAMRKETRHRYGSVEQLMDDIDRHLNNAPVQARNGNWAYYSSRFVRRHWVGVATSAFVIVVLSSVALLLSIQKDRVARERDLARQESERAEAVSNFMLEVFSSSDPFETQGRKVTAQELLDKAGARIRQDLSQQPVVRARLMAAIGIAYQRQGKPEEGINYLQDAIILLRRQSGTPPELMAQTLNILGRSQSDQGAYLQARKTLEQAIAFLNQHNLTDSQQYLQILTDMAPVVFYLNDFDAAESFATRAISLAHNIQGNAHPAKASALSILAAIREKQGDYQQAYSLMQQAANIFHATLADTHPDRILADLQLATLSFKLGKWDEGRQQAEASLARQKDIFGSDNIRLVETLDQLSLMAGQQRKWEQAEAYSREAVRITNKVLGDEAGKTVYARLALADVLIQRKKFKEAESQLQTTSPFFKQPANINTNFAALADYFLASIQINTHRSQQAVKLLNKNITHWKSIQAPAWRIARSQFLLGVALRATGKAKEGTLLMRDAFSIVAATGSGAFPQVVSEMREWMQRENLAIPSMPATSTNHRTSSSTATSSLTTSSP